MMKEWICKACAMLFCGVFVILLSMAVNQDDAQVDEENVSSYVVSYLKELGIKDFEVRRICEPKRVRKSVQLSCTEKEINDYMVMDLENYDSLEEIDKSIIEVGDFIRIEYAMDKSMNNSNKFILKIGKNNFDKKIEEALVGKKTGRIYSLKNSDNQIEYIKVESIIKYVKQTLTTEFIKNTLGFDSREDYVSHIKTELYKEKKQIEGREATNEFYDKILSESEIKLNSQEVVDFCMNYYVKNEQQMAIANNQSFENYIRQMYQMKKEEYYRKVYDEGEDEIKEIIVTGVLASRINYDKKADYNAMKKAVVEHYVSIEYLETK